MRRFLLVSVLWMLGTFGLLVWVQQSVAISYRDAMIHVALSSSPSQGEGVERLRADRDALMNRLRVLWVTTALVPLLVGGWWVARGRTGRGSRRTGEVT